jgi:hypothetical protein
LGTGRSRGARAFVCEDGVQELRHKSSDTRVPTHMSKTCVQDLCPRLGPPAAAIGRSPACRQVASGLLAHDGRL